MSQAQNLGLRKRQRGLDASIVTGDSDMDTSRCADKLWCFLCTCTVVSPQKIKAGDGDIHEMMSQ